MRSSASSSNKEDFEEERPLSFFRGATWFLLALVVAGFFGGAVRSLLSPRHIAQMVEETLTERQPAFAVNFSQARFSLGQGLKPRFGLEFDRVMIQAKDPQVTTATLFIENLYFPIALTQVLRRKLAFSQIEASEVILNLASGEQLAPAAAEHVDPVELAESPSSQVWSDLLRFIELRWRQELINTQAILRSIRIERLLLRAEELEGQWVALSDLELKVSQRELGGKIHGALEFSPDWLEGFQALPASPFELNLTPDKADFAIRGQWREGRYRLSYQVDLDQLKYRAEMQLTSMPQQPLWNLFRQWVPGGESWPDIGWPNQWVNCMALSTGSLADIYKNKMLSLEDCSSGGDFGYVQLDRAEVPAIFNALKALSSLGAEKPQAGPSDSDQTSEVERWPSD